MPTQKIFWYFGRSGAGKSTLAQLLHLDFIERKIPVLYLDGDEVRSGLCSDLGFSSDARLENHRRIAQIAKLAADQGFNVIVSTMAPEYSQRDIVKRILKKRLVWIHIFAPLDVCIQRDPKKLYSKAMTGKDLQIFKFPFEVPRPEENENFVDTQIKNIGECHKPLLNVALNHLSKVENNLIPT